MCRAHNVHTCKSVCVCVCACVMHTCGCIHICTYTSCWQSFHCKCMECPVTTHTGCHTGLLFGINNKPDQQGSLHFRISFFYLLCIFYWIATIFSLLVTCEQKFTRLTNVWLEKLRTCALSFPGLCTCICIIFLSIWGSVSPVCYKNYMKCALTILKIFRHI